MATATDLITDSLVHLGIRASETALQADEIQDGLNRLNDMLAEWEEAGLLLGFSPVADVADEVRIPRGANAAVKYALAIRSAPDYGRTVSAALAENARDSLKNMLNANVFIGDVDFPATLPKGSGNHCWDDEWLNSRFFPQNLE